MGGQLHSPDKFYRDLKSLSETGFVVGPVITNNFDGMSSRTGMDEIYVRRYEEQHITPDIEFSPGAKSLIVVGSHADRRRVQHAAREQGLKVIYIDPEGYQLETGEFVDYAMESPQDNDLLFKTTAMNAMNNLLEVINQNPDLKEKFNNLSHSENILGGRAKQALPDF